MAVSAAKRLGLPPPATPLDPPSVPGDGRSHRDAEPPAHVVHLPQGDRRAQRPDRHPVMGALLGEPHAGRPVLRPPRSGTSSAGNACGHRVREQLARWPTTYGTTYLVAARALSRADHRQQLADPPLQGMPRGPAT